MHRKDKIVTKEKTPKNEYPCIRMYGRLMGSYQYYITAQVEQARRDGAPQTATSKRSLAPHEDWSERNQADLWRVVEPKGDPLVQPQSDFYLLVLQRVKEEYGLSYEDVLAWDKASEKTKA